MAQKALACLILSLGEMGIVGRIFHMLVAENKMHEKEKKNFFQFAVLNLEENKSKGKSPGVVLLLSKLPHPRGLFN